MEGEVKDKQNNSIILNGKSDYYYTVKRVEITNILGSVSAVLNEYFITNNSGENYKLYKTKEGNWFDVSEENSNGNKGTIRALKSAIDNK